MALKILIRNYRIEDTEALANIYYHTIHKINIQHYTEEQVDVWAPASSLETEGWAKKFPRTKPIIATVGDEVVGFAEFEPNGHIDCFYCHHDRFHRSDLSLGHDRGGTASVPPSSQWQSD